MKIVVEVMRDTLTAFCKEFVAQPYLDYTEHGQHARFFTRLYNALPREPAILRLQWTPTQRPGGNTGIKR